MTRSARLVLVGTPIGNLGDLSPRAAEALGDADVVVLRGHPPHRAAARPPGCPAPELLRLNDHTEVERSTAWSAASAAARSSRSSATPGCPAVGPGCAPGRRRRRRATCSSRWCPARSPERSPSGQRAADPSGRFCFEGFLPRKGSARAQRLVGAGRRAAHGRALRGTAPAGPHARRPGRRRAARIGGWRCAGELTKLHEEFWRGTLAEAVEHCVEVDPTRRVRRRAGRRPRTRSARRRGAA